MVESKMSESEQSLEVPETKPLFKYIIIPHYQKAFVQGKLVKMGSSSLRGTKFA